MRLPAPLVADIEPAAVVEQQRERGAGVHRAAVEEVPRAAGVVGVDQLGVRLAAEQRLGLLPGVAAPGGCSATCRRRPAAALELDDREARGNGLTERVRHAGQCLGRPGAIVAGLAQTVTI